jgi:hypothetical protein
LNSFPQSAECATSNDLTLKGEHHDHHRQQHNDRAGGDLTPWDVIRLHHADNRDWNRLCVDFREHKRQDQFVPGENKCENGDDRQRGARYREVDSQQQLKMAAAVNERCVIKLPSRGKSRKNPTSIQIAKGSEKDRYTQTSPARVSRRPSL